MSFGACWKVLVWIQEQVTACFFVRLLLHLDCVPLTNSQNVKCTNWYLFKTCNTISVILTSLVDSTLLFVELHSHTSIPQHCVPCFRDHQLCNCMGSLIFHSIPILKRNVGVRPITRTEAGVEYNKEYCFSCDFYINIRHPHSRVCGTPIRSLW